MSKSNYGLSLFGAASTIAMSLALAGGAYAQEAIEQVVVTGTRLPAGLTSPTPVATVSAASIANRAPSQVIEALYDIPAFKLTAGATQGQRGVGTAATVNLRGLGGARSLTLVNGRRPITADTSRIPSNLIERVEIVTGGASAAYGSDAVAGVVNFILNDNFEGLRTNAQVSIAEAGDNEGYSLSLSYGTKFGGGRGTFIFGTDYAWTAGTGNIYSRKWGRKEPGQVSPNAAQRAAQGLPANILTNGVQFLATGTNYGIITSGPLAGQAFDANGGLYAFPIGTQYGSPPSGQSLTTLQVGSKGNIGNTTLGTFYLAMPIKRSATMARATYDLTDNLKAFGDVMVSFVSGNAVTGNQQIPNGVMGSFLVQTANPYITPATRAQLTAAGVTQFAIGIVPVKAVANADGNTAFQNRARLRTIQTTAGLEGTLADWDWDVSFSHGRSRNIGAWPNALHVPNFGASTYVVTGANGQPACGPIATNPNLTAATRLLVEPNCVPFNIFGQPSPEAIKYVSPGTRSVSRTTENIVAFNVGGTPFELWAGPVAVAVGGEYRAEDFRSSNEGFSARAFATGGSTPYAGKRNVNEVYLEIGLPLLRDEAFAQSLELNGAARRTDYQYSGVVETYKVGATWDVNDAIRFRVTQSRDIRAPDIGDLFALGGQTTTQGVRNPFNGQVGALISGGGGNRDLKPEVAQTFTSGFVLRPTWDWASRFTLTTDYYWIKLKGAIAGVGVTQILQRCFNGVQTYCDAITFDNSGYGIARVETRSYNQNQIRAKGVDIEVSYRAPIEDLNIGRLNIRALGGYQPTLTTIDNAGVSVNTAGTGIGVPEWRWTVNFDWAYENLSAQLQAIYTNKILATPNLIGPDDPTYESIKTTSSITVNKNLFPDMIYWNLSTQYRINDRFQLYANINNLFDKQPPELAMIAFTGVGGQSNPYDPLGRMFRFGVRGTF